MKRLNRAGAEQVLADPNTPEETKREVREILKQLSDLYEENPLQAFYPHPKQVTFLGAHTSIKAFLGGNRSGKTTCGIVDDLIQAVDEDCLPSHLKPAKRWGKGEPFYCRIISPDFTSTMEGVIFQKLREWVPRAQLQGGSWDKAYNKQRRRLSFANGSWFDFMTFEQDLDKFGGAALHRVHYDEEPPEQIRKECRARLIDHGGDELFTMTPLQGMTWMFDEIYEKRYVDNVTVVEVDTEENPHLDQAAMREFFDSLTDEEREARKKGRFVHFGGLVLFMFDDTKHLVDPIDPAHLRGLDVYVGIDPGVARGGIVWCAFDRDNNMLVFDELYPRNQDIEQQAAEIHAKNAEWRLKNGDVIYIIDPSGRNKTLTGEQGPREEFQRFDIFAKPAHNSRRTGIFQLRRRLNAEKPGLIVTRNCLNWLWERGRWRVAADEMTTQEKAKTDRSGDTFATQGPDHTMDPTRYVAMERPWGPWVQEGKKARYSFTPDFEGPYRPGQEDFLQNSPPMGALS